MATAVDLLPATQVQQLLTGLSYWNGSTAGDLREEAFRDALKKFQTEVGLFADGVYGSRVDTACRGLLRLLGKAPAEMKQCRRWRLTSYYVAEEGDQPGPPTVPIPDVNGNPLGLVSARDYASAALEGTIRMKDGRLLNVAGSTVKAKAEDYESVLAFAERNKWIPDKPGYAGLTLDKSNTRVVAVAAFHVVNAAQLGVGYGVQRGVPLSPFRTLAADIGYPKYKNADPTFKGKGGVCPPGTEVFILEFVGVQCPDGKGGWFTHDGWFVVNDTGGGICGAHFDVFSGTHALSREMPFPHIGHVWFRGTDPVTNKTFTSDSRVPWSYSYGI